MKFADAAHVRMPFGKHFGRKLDEIASTDEGLLYLDWLRGDREKRIGAVAANPHFDTALRAYLDDPTIAAELTKLARGRA
jgi:hypothetical protein